MEILELKNTTEIRNAKDDKLKRKLDTNIASKYKVDRIKGEINSFLIIVGGLNSIFNRSIGSKENSTTMLPAFSELGT